MPAPIECETERLRLVVWHERHMAPFAAMGLDPEVMRYFPALQTREQSRAAVESWQAQIAERGWSFWAAELRATREFIGVIGLTIPRHALPFSPCVEVGWRLARSHWGRGYATEGARSCLRVGFERLDVAQIVSFTALQNRPSRAVMERIGMVDLQQDFDHPAVPEGSDLRRHCVYTITRERWHTLGGGGE